MTQTMTIDQALQMAMQHHQAGQLQQAEAIYRRVLEIHPNHSDALHLLGVIASQVGRYDVALDLINRAIALVPTASAYQRNLGRALMAMGRIDDSIVSYRRSLELGPDDAETAVLLGDALQAADQLPEAIAAFENAVRLRPNYAEAFVFLGNALHSQGKFHPAIDCFHQAIKFQPDLPEAHSNLSISQRCIGQIEPAIASAKRAIELKPDYYNACNNLAAALNSAGRLDEAIQVFRDALVISPDSARLRFNLGLTLLLAGQFEEGWREHEWRYKVAEHASLRQDFYQPIWDGQPLEGRRILVLGEQGFGDTIQFSRYIPMIAARGGKVLFVCQPELTRLLRNTPGLEAFITSGQPAPQFDFHCHLLSLPFIFKTTLETIPQPLPNLRPDAGLIERWRLKLAGETRLKVGLVWAGRPTHKDDRIRSIALETFAPLAKTRDDIAFFSLQKGAGSDQAEHPPSGMNLTNWADELTDFTDTAALIENLDLVIAVDTSVAHLAASLGKPTWVLLPAAPDWRWMPSRRAGTPWYPSMRLFRQDRLGDWQGVIRKVVEAIRLFQIPKP